jgi:hypothetical protein
MAANENVSQCLISGFLEITVSKDHLCLKIRWSREVHERKALALKQPYHKHI